MADEMRTSYVGQCKVCGQLVVFEEDKEPKDVDEGATLNCTCPEGGAVKGHPQGA